MKNFLDVFYVGTLCWFFVYLGINLAHYLKSKEMLTTLEVNEKLENEYMGVVQRAVVYVYRSNENLSSEEKFKLIENIVLDETYDSILEQPQRDLKSDIEYVLHNEGFDEETNTTF